MTLTVTTPTEPGDAGLLIPRWTEFLAQNSARMARVLGMPDIKTTAITTTNDTGQVIDLTDAGFSFLASRLYRVKLKYFAQTDNDRWYFERTYPVLGGTTPVVLDLAPIIENAYGRIVSAAAKYGFARLAASYATTTATVITAMTDEGVTIGNTSSGVATITHPITRTGGGRCVSVHGSTDVTLNTEHRYPAVEAGVSTTTMELSLMAEGVTSATGIVADFADVGFIDALLYLLPPVDAFVTMNSNNVEVHVLGITSDEVLHTVEVFIDEGTDVPFQGS